MRRVGITAVVLFCTLFSALSTRVAPAQKPAATPPPSQTAERHRLDVESFEVAWKTIRDKLWDPKIRGLNWQAVHDELKPKVERAKSSAEARRVIRDMLKRLKVSHCAVIPAKAYQEISGSGKKKGANGNAGIWVRIADKRPLVVRVHPKSPAAKAGVMPGWEVVAIGDIVVSKKLAELAKKLDRNPRKPAYLASAVMSGLRGKIGRSVSVKFRDGCDRMITKTIAMAQPRGRKMKFGHLPAAYIWHESRRLKPNVGYFAFNAFLDPLRVMQGYNEAMASFRDADGVIVDVRGNGGGSAGIALGMIGWFITGESRQVGTFHLRGQKLKMVVTPRATTYSGPVVVLIDEHSGSASEFFASALQDLGRAHIVGTRTMGAVLGSQIIKLPNGDGLQFPFSNYISSKRNAAVEGVGVIPDIAVKRDRRLLLEGKDPALQAALKWIRTQKRKTAQPNNR